MKWWMIFGVAAIFAQNAMQQEMAQMAASSESAKNSGASALFMINPADRAKDFMDTFDYLKKVQPSAKPTFRLMDKSMISNIISIEVSSGGSLLVFKVGSTQGVKYRVVKVEEIDTIVP